MNTTIKWFYMCKLQYQFTYQISNGKLVCSNHITTLQYDSTFDTTWIKRYVI